MGDDDLNCVGCSVDFGIKNVPIRSSCMLIYVPFSIPISIQNQSILKVYIVQFGWDNTFMDYNSWIFILIHKSAGFIMFYRLL